MLPKGQCDALPLTRLAESPRRTDAPSSVVLQCALPRGSAVNIERIPWASEYEHALPPRVENKVPLFVYNFGPHAIQGTVRIERMPDGCQVQPHQWQVELQPMQRKELTVNFTVSEELTGQADDDWITLRGDFGADNQPVVAFRLIAK